MINLSTLVFTEIFMSVGANRHASVVQVVVWTGRSDGMRDKGKLLFVMFDCLSDDTSLPFSCGNIFSSDNNFDIDNIMYGLYKVIYFQISLLCLARQ